MAKRIQKKEHEDFISNIDRIDEIDDIIIVEESILNEYEDDEEDDPNDIKEEDFDEFDNDLDSDFKEIENNKTTYVESILYKIPVINDPLIGSPKVVQKELDKIAIKIQKDPNSAIGEHLYNKIHLYMHGYLINVALRQFPYIKGLQTSDIYQEALIALRFKAIPHFEMNKGMSFLNFAKMCIRRHLITILNTSKTRKKDQSMNQSISIDTPIGDKEDGNTIANTLKDHNVQFDKVCESKEAFEFTRDKLVAHLSDFEKDVLLEYLYNLSYKEIAVNITCKTKTRCVPKAVDNALLRIRGKAALLREMENDDNLPMFL